MRSQPAVTFTADWTLRSAGSVLLSVPGVRTKHGEAEFSYHEPNLREKCRSAPLDRDWRHFCSSDFHSGSLKDLNWSVTFILVSSLLNFVYYCLLVLMFCFLLLMYFYGIFVSESWFINKLVSDITVNLKLLEFGLSVWWRFSPNTGHFYVLIWKSRMFWWISTNNQ